VSRKAAARPVERAATSRELVAVGHRLGRLVSGTIVGPVGVAMTTWALALTAVPVSHARAQRVLAVIAHDTALEASPTVPAGLLTVRLVLKGQTRRELVMHRVPVGTTPEEVARGAAGRTERWFQRWSLGGPAVPRDSAVEANATLDVRPGRYVLVAYEVDQAGRVRPARYIWREVTAIAASVLIPARFSVPDARVRIKDGSIEVLGAMRPGQRTLQIENIGGRPHEAIVGRLKPGKTVADAQRWSREGTGEAPFVYAGGITPISPGVTAQTRLVLQSGVHVVLCPMRGERGTTSDNGRGVITSFRVS